MKKKIFRVFGYIVCALLIILCILMVISSSLFGASKIVGVFGANVYVVDNDDLPTAPKGSAVLVKKCVSSDLEVGNPVLFLKSDENDEPALGYVESMTARDGVYYITVTHGDSIYEFPESKLVGRANYSSMFWGGVIRFIKTPIGIMVIAVLPCAALILFDIVRAAAANKPEPEVVPKVKNADEEPPHTDIKLSVDTEGKALYAKDRSLKTLPKDSNVLFNYSGKQKSVSEKTAKQDRPIIPLTDRKTRSPAPEPKTSDNTGKIFNIKLPSEATEAVQTTDTEAKAVRGSATGISAERSAPEPENTLHKNAVKTAARKNSSEKTAELPIIGKKTSSDAFFAQPSAGRQLAPQIGKQRRQILPDDEAPASNLTRSKPERTAGKRSTQILASKSFDDLLSDDDDMPYSRSSSDKAVDDILASIEHRK